MLRTSESDSSVTLALGVQRAFAKQPCPEWWTAVQHAALATMVAGAMSLAATCLHAHVPVLQLYISTQQDRVLVV
jgi:hypothetical protein